MLAAGREREYGAGVGGRSAHTHGADAARVSHCTTCERVDGFVRHAGAPRTVAPSAQAPSPHGRTATAHGARCGGDDGSNSNVKKHICSPWHPGLVPSSDSGPWDTTSLETGKKERLGTVIRVSGLTQCTMVIDWCV